MSHCKECRSILDKFEVDTCKACGTEAPSVGTKTKYTVSVREVHIQLVDIEADNEQDAIERVKQGEGRTWDAGLEYSRTLPTDTWTVEKK